MKDRDRNENNADRVRYLLVLCRELLRDGDEHLSGEALLLV
jgi:hypothetical protein